MQSAEAELMRLNDSAINELFDAQEQNQRLLPESTDSVPRMFFRNATWDSIRATVEKRYTAKESEETLDDFYRFTVSGGILVDVSGPRTKVNRVKISFDDPQRGAEVVARLRGHY